MRPPRKLASRTYPVRTAPAGRGSTPLPGLPLRSHRAPRAVLPRGLDARRAQLRRLRRDSPPVQDSVISFIAASAGEGGVIRPLAPFRAGDRVQIRSGLLAG